MAPSEIAIATSTFYRPDSVIDRSRMDLARETVKLATDNGYGIVVVDGGSPDEFLRQLESYGAVVESEKEKGMGPARRQAIRSAFNLGNIVTWTEPEKVSYISQIPKVVKPITEDVADITIPARTSLDSYPISQQHAEKFGNSFFRELTGRTLDMWIGVRAFNEAGSKYFLDYDGRYGDKWDLLFIPVLDALHDGARVVGVDIDYVHPSVQKALEEGHVAYTTKRLDQLNNLVPAMAEHWAKLNA